MQHYPQQHYPHMPPHYGPPLQHYGPLHAPTGQYGLPLPHFTQQYAGHPQYPLMRPDTKIPVAPELSRMQPNLEAPAPSPVFDVDVITGNMKRGFRGEADMPWEDFKSRVLAYLDSTAEEVQLVYKFAGYTSKATHLNDAEAFSIAMNRLCHKASNARTQVVALEVKNAAKQTIATKAKKRTRKDDIPPASSDENPTQLKAYKQLESQIRCELHHGHCFVNCTSGYDNHCRLDHAEMTLWAKKIPHNSSPPPLSQPCNSSPPPLSQLVHYPEIGALLGVIDANKPELRIGELETSLLNAGVVSSSQVILLPEDVLSVIGDMGQKRARILRNYAKRTVLPLLGL
ncbi:hypothetical protein EV702DRAFT_945908, partial [Suillus placidus]